jgi:hypothetical protein
MKTLVGGGGTAHDLRPGVFICKMHSWLCLELDRSSGLRLSCLPSLTKSCSDPAV